jgi:MFS family permease
MASDPDLLASKPPGWLKTIPLFSTPPPLTHGQWRMFTALAIASIFNQYDVAILQFALPQIQASLGMNAAEISSMVAIIKLGALPAFLLMVLADRWGRSRILLLTVIAYTMLTLATAFVQSITLFTLVQFLARLFITTEILLAAVVIAEEFPDGARGWGIGAFMALASYGYAFAAILFALIDLLPFGWRSLYVVGIGPLLVIIRLRQALPETRRFREQQARHAYAEVESRGAIHLRPLRQLMRAYPKRFILMGLVALLVNFGSEAAGFYDPAFLQTARGWQPWQITILTIGVGVVAVFGSTLAGQLGDHFERKWLGSFFIVASMGAIVLFYTSAGPLLSVIWGLMLLAFRGMGVTLATLGAELFPTSYRSTASGAQSLLANSGVTLAFVAHSALTQVIGSPWTAIWLLSLTLLLTPLLLAFLPNTKGRSLEEIAPEAVVQSKEH